MHKKQYKFCPALNLPVQNQICDMRLALPALRLMPTNACKPASQESHVSGRINLQACLSLVLCTEFSSLCCQATHQHTSLRAEALKSNLIRQMTPATALTITLAGLLRRCGLGTAALQKSVGAKAAMVTIIAKCMNELCFHDVNFLAAQSDGQL